MAENWEDGAEAWGNYNCDLPKETAELLFMYLKNMHPSEKPDLIFWTGDSTPHDVWNQTIHKNIMYTVEISKFLDDNMPEIPVVAVPGNHEFYPVNVMEFDDDSDVVLNKIGDQWSEWFT